MSHECINTRQLAGGDNNEADGSWTQLGKREQRSSLTVVQRSVASSVTTNKWAIECRMMSRAALMWFRLVEFSSEVWKPNIQFPPQKTGRTPRPGGEVKVTPRLYSRDRENLIGQFWNWQVTKICSGVHTIYHHATLTALLTPDVKRSPVPPDSLRKSHDFESRCLKRNLTKLYETTERQILNHSGLIVHPALDSKH